MPNSSADKPLQTVSDFYNGKSVFLTGATGFVGTVLMELLLRCCPGIKSIYILLRTKKNEPPEVRKEKNFKKKIFEKIREESPELLNKIYVIPGDASLPDLGMSKEDVQLLIEEVSIVFHCAATVNFLKPLKFTLISNVLSLRSIIGLCKQMRKLEALVYTSTAYSNSNHKNSLTKEEVYRLPFHADTFLDAMKNSHEKLQDLIDYCKPDWPNAYTFSKCLAENLIADTASDLPVAIIRPSIIFCTWSTMPGYFEENSGLGALSVGTGKGFVKVLHADPNLKLDLVPVDIVANAHVVAAWSVGTKRCKSPLVVNCTGTDKLQVSLLDFITTLSKISFKFPLPLSFDRQSVLSIISNKYLYYIVAAYKHYIPAVVLDGILKLLGKKPKVFFMYRFFDTITNSLNFFLFHSYQFEKNNLEKLDTMICPEDRKDFSLDFSKATLFGMSQYIPVVASFYDWNLDKRSKSERQKIKYRRHLLICCIQGMFLMICCLIIYSVFSFVFR